MVSQISYKCKKRRSWWNNGSRANISLRKETRPFDTESNWNC